MDVRTRSYLDRAAEATAAGRYEEAAGFERVAASRLDGLAGEHGAARAALLDQAARRQLAAGAAGEARGSLEALLVLRERVGHAVATADVLRRLGLADQLEGREAAALERFAAALDVARGLPNAPVTVATLLARSNSLRRLGRVAEARADLVSARDRARAGHDPRGAIAAQHLLDALDAATGAPRRTPPPARTGHTGASRGPGASAPRPGPGAGAPPRPPASSGAARGPAHTPSPAPAPGAPAGEPGSTRPAAIASDPDIEAVLAELDALVGLAEVKRQVRSLVNFLRVQQRRASPGHDVVRVSQHLAFTGAPGTGKTTVARIFGRLLKALGVLAGDTLVETSRGQLVAGYVGQTAARVNEVVDSALDGVLFIDEAYALTESAGPSDFGREAVNELIKRMEDDRDRLAVIFAGYPEPMRRFLRSNPGLESRVSEVILFADYAPAELVAIFSAFCARHDYRLGVGTEARLSALAERMHAERDERFGNARTMRNLFEDAITAQANRLVETGATDLVTLEAADVEAACESYRAGREA